MKTYTLAVDDLDDREIVADGDEDARQAAIDHLLLSFEPARSSRQRVRLRRKDGSDVWSPDTVANLVS